jgi:hypothetical protein
MQLLRQPWFGPLLVGLLLIGLLVPTMPYEATSQTDDDDDDMSGGALAVLLLAVGGAVGKEEVYGANRLAAQSAFDQLSTAAAGAIIAESGRDRPQELSQVSRAIGAAEALIGMTPSCGETCDDVKSSLQHVVGILARAKSKLTGPPKSCQPNGIVQPREQCDPLAVPTGCSTSSTPVLFCNAECQCRGIVP